MSELMFAVVASAVAIGALAFYAPDENALASWGQTLDVALAKTRPVLVKAGSKW